MNDTIANMVAELVPHLLWIVLILVVLGWLGRKQVREVLSKVTKIGLPGFTLELAGEVEQVARKRGVLVTETVRAGIAGSVERLLVTARGARVLWIDPVPEGNAKEMAILTRLGAVIDLARGDGEAKACLHGAVYDLVLSNMTRDGNRSAGEDFIPEIRAVALPPAVIFYVGEARPNPPLAFGITTRPNELFRLIQQALERRA